VFFSILTPCYNSAPFITDTIETLLAQDFDDWELILINDGSRDNTLEVLNALAQRDPRIRVIDQENSGVSVSRNRGIAEASGKWILGLDHDDAFMPGALSELKRLIDDTPDAECFVFPYCAKNEDGGVHECVDRVFREFGNRTFSGSEAFDLLYSQRQYRGQHWHPWRFVFRKECPPHFTPGVIHEDLDAMPFYVAERKAVCIAARPYYRYTLDAPTAVTRSFSPKRVADICSVTRKLYQKMDEISSGKSALNLSCQCLKGFRAVIAYNLFGYYLASDTFDEPERTQALSLFEANKEWLLAIDKPRFQAGIKRLLLRTLGVKNTARILHRMK
jgi:glycosyltransferase involved in cell wall biosynthesis